MNKDENATHKVAKNSGTSYYVIVVRRVECKLTPDENTFVPACTWMLGGNHH